MVNRVLVTSVRKPGLGLGSKTGLDQPGGLGDHRRRYGEIAARSKQSCAFGVEWFIAISDGNEHSGVYEEHAV